MAASKQDATNADKKREFPPPRRAKTREILLFAIMYELPNQNLAEESLNRTYSILGSSYKQEVPSCRGKRPEIVKFSLKGQTRTVE
jgi:hypothetical protein